MVNSGAYFSQNAMDDDLLADILNTPTAVSNIHAVYSISIFKAVNDNHHSISQLIN
jgi:hypothetical protein